MSPAEAAIVIGNCVASGGKILICGNGGSAAESSHFAAELVVRYKRDRRAIPAISLTADSAVITACANDYGYERVFSRQIEALGQPGDVLVAFSTSGKSANVLKAIEKAKVLGMTVIEPPRRETTRHSQELHLSWLHDICEVLDDAAAA